MTVQSPGSSTSAARGGGACSYVPEPPGQVWDPEAVRNEQDWRNLDAELDRERVPEAPEVPGFRNIGDLRQASCSFCPYIRSRKLVKNHMDRVHRGGKPGAVCCAVCGVQTSRKSDLSLHIQREHGATY
jgi:hypothetical protein